MNPVYSLTDYFLKMYFNIILTPMPNLLTSLFPSGFETKNLIPTSYFAHAFYMPRPSQPLWFYQPNTTPGIKRQGRVADHSPQTNAEVKKMWIYKSTPPYAFMA
jgi:hypothetical protein